MAFETKKFGVVRKKLLEKSTFAVDCNLESEVEIDKILSVCHSAQVDSVEVLNGVVNFTGFIDTCVLFLTVDGQVSTLTSSCPFSSTILDEMVCVGDKVQLFVSVEDYKIESVATTSLKITCQCQQSGVLICPREVETATSSDENICQKTDEILLTTFVGQAKENFAVESEFSIKEPIKKIVCAQSQVNIKSAECGVNFVSVSGEVITRLLALTDGERYESTYVTENFKEELELEGVTRESLAESVACVCKGGVQLEVEDAERGVSVKAKTPIEVSVCAYAQVSESVVQDVYCTESELKVTTSSFEMTKCHSCEIFEEKIDGALTLDEDKPRVDKIMFVGGSNIFVTNAYISGGEAFVEGITKTNVVYLNDETSALHSVAVEVPFVVSDKTDLQEDAHVHASAVLCDVDVGVKKGREFLFDAKLKICVCGFSDETGAVISNVEIAENFAERDCAIELVFAKEGQSAWDIAKASHVQEEQIYLQNPELAFPLAKDENVIIYYKLR